MPKHKAEANTTNRNETHVTNKIKLPERVGDIVANKVETDISRATSFDDSIDDALVSYLGLLGIDEQSSNVSMDVTSSTLKLTYGSNPQVKATLISRTIYNVFASYIKDFDDCRIVVDYVPNQNEMVLHVQYKNDEELRIVYDPIQHSELPDDVATYIEETLNEFNQRKVNDPILMNETFEYVRTLMMNAYHIQDDAYILDEDKLKEIQRLVVKSSIFELPLSFSYTQYSMYIKGEFNLLIMIDGFNEVNVDYFKYIPLQLSSGIPVTLVYSDGYISFQLPDYEFQRYEYINDEIHLITNDGYEPISLEIEEELLEISREYSVKYAEVNNELQELSMKIKELINE